MMNINEKNVLETYFINGGNTKDFNVLTALSECESTLELKIFLAYTAFCRYNCSITSDESKLATVETLRKKYESNVKDIAEYCEIADKKTFYALFSQTLYRVATINDGEQKSNFKRIPYTAETAKNRALMLITTLIFDNIDNALNAFEVYVMEEKSKAKKTLQSAQSELHKLEKDLNAFRTYATLFEIAEDNNARITKENKFAESRKKISAKIETAQKKYDDINAKSLSEWEEEFFKKYGENAL